MFWSHRSQMLHREIISVNHEDTEMGRVDEVLARGIRGTVRLGTRGKRERLMTEE